MERKSMAWQGNDGMECKGKARQGKERHGMERKGLAWNGMERHGMGRNGRKVVSWKGK